MACSEAGSWFHELRRAGMYSEALVMPWRWPCLGGRAQRAGGAYVVEQHLGAPAGRRAQRQARIRQLHALQGAGLGAWDHRVTRVIVPQLWHYPQLQAAAAKAPI